MRFMFQPAKSGVFTDASNYGIPIDPLNLTNIRPSTVNATHTTVTNSGAGVLLCAVKPMGNC